MPLELNMQINLVIYSVIGGIITGILFDIYRVIRGLNSFKILNVIEDMLFCVLIALIVFSFLLYINYAFLTPYVYIFIVISTLLYFRLLSKYFYKSEIIIAKLFYKLIRILLKNIRYPLKMIAYKIADRKK
ncbi:spore cortex biosynthesis protein YabQ [Clostridium saccharoperbutylacetonicum]|uniref:Spore cortex biosynthesis protein YabQ n=1 Tax=Clostridium saccharoperbutylacetonicum N1-4(HMT) TaxID=931276 RepID=M1MQP4_9CLOT|nr:spore cortex biosynthesis protein YabQ [Clostridium saccharoperbutylacetonicum]AGF53952.1 spore cortex biosynthesis protein YabQ [Clostridium saccharoperbutylacetonicum N1-4(HMT)]NRT59535.1 spore cortex biosynthesis protein YabQ [Clostridium saccharoperbutylacetonicum]NSB28727.1 spore cortex biosynthesis protein YabQ [Clostridium saccharoperbutylacetonicum]NSB42218.1 spore cortex biosynthesis protein YabQ [Clostridium saccharoperbutylacetonicum]